MSAIPGGAVTFDILSRANDGGVREMEKRIQKTVADAKKHKVVIPVALNTQQLSSQIRQVQQAASGGGGAWAYGQGFTSSGGPIPFSSAGNRTPAHQALRNAQALHLQQMRQAQMHAAGFGSAGQRGGAPGWLSPSLKGVGPMSGRGTGADDEPYQKVIKAAVILRGVTDAIEATNGLIDEHYAKQSGNLDRIVAAEKNRAQTLRSIPIAGALGGGIRDLFQGGDRAAIAQTLDDAAAGDRKSAFMATQNARRAAERDTLRAMQFQAMGERGATGTQIELAQVRQTLSEAQPGKVTDALRRREMDLAARDHGEREVLEERHLSNIARIREEAAVELLREEGFALAAEREQLIAGFMQTDRDMEIAAKEATARGDTAGAARIRQLAGEQKMAQGGRLRAFDIASAVDEARKLEESGTDAAAFMAGAGQAVVTKSERERERALDVRSIDSEARQIQLRSRGQDRRAEMEAIKERAIMELEATEDPTVRAAIKRRAETELGAMLNMRGSGAVVANAGLTSFGAKPGQDGVERVLRGDILRALREIRDKENLARAS